MKPDNIFLLEREGRQDVVKIVDFGLAKLDAGQRLTQDGTVVGTAEYISPEQVTGRDTDARSDQYALGCILYEMLTSQLPFDGPTTTDVVYKHVYKQPIPPRKVRPLAQIPEALEQVIARCMAKKPADRFEKMTDLETALTAIEQVLIGSSQAAVVLPPPASRLPRGLVWLALLGLPLLVVLTLQLALRSDGIKDGQGAGSAVDLPPQVVLRISLQDLGSPASRSRDAGTSLGAASSPTTAPEHRTPENPAAVVPAIASKPSVMAKLAISPKKALATVTCGGETIGCSPTCQITIPSGSGCELTAPGFRSKTLLAHKAKRQGVWRVALTKAKR
ncbi:MAG: serine/threonine protein kinase [Deltaproteobacteria bacterium]|nr:serine/threonine protein kinase [Deltaproteobacteria bacterium]